MLFDLQSPGRRTAIKIIYSMLAVLMGGGLILFGIGGGGLQGGLLDAVGLTNSAGNNTGGSFEDQISDQEDKVKANPQSEAAILDLATLHFNAAQQQLDTDPETGQTSLTDGAVDQYERTADAWDQYLALDPKKPDSNVANLVAQSYIALARQTDISGAALRSNLAGAVAAQRIVADAEPSGGTLAQLAIFLYYNGDFVEGDKVAKQAEAKAEPSARSQIHTSLLQTRKEAKQLDKALKAQEKAEKAAQGATGSTGPANPFQNPLAGG